MDIHSLAARCELGVAEATALSDRLMADGMSAGAGADQRRLVTAAHCLIRIAQLWQERLPIIPGENQPVASEVTDLGTYRSRLLAELNSWAIDPDLDPSTHLLASRLQAELALIAEIHP